MAFSGLGYHVWALAQALRRGLPAGVLSVDPGEHLQRPPRPVSPRKLLALFHAPNLGSWGEAQVLPDQCSGVPGTLGGCVCLGTPRFPPQQGLRARPASDAWESAPVLSAL